MRSIVLQNITVLLDRNTTVKDGSLDIRQVLGETLVLMRNLECQFTSVAKNQNRDLVLALWEGGGVELMESGQDKDSCLSHSGLGLADNVHSQNSLWNALVLHFGRMLETTVHNSTEALRLENEILETGSMDTDIVTPV
jgi:hypothetical protein